MADCADILSLPEFEERARLCLPPMAYEFLASGAAEEHTVRWNREAYDRIRLHARVLRDVSAIDTRVTLLGREHPFPILLAPTAYHRVLHPDGELETARGASAAGATWVVSMSTTTALDEIARVSSAPLWFQLYVQSDRAFTHDVVQAVEEAGCEALVLTVDSPVIGPRNRQARARFSLPAGVTTPYLYDIGRMKQPIMNPRRVVATWTDVAWLRSVTRLPLLLKGIMDADDAELAVQAGAQAVIVSNHGGRNLDTAPATIDVLPHIVSRVEGRIPVLVDGGVRRGTDVLKALAFGATAALIGRPYCYGLSVGGADGVARVVAILRHELEVAMMLTGISSIAGIDRRAIWPTGEL
jgi:4-hydroxymandelate oxidase